MPDTSPILLITRPDAQAHRFHAQLEKSAGKPIEAVIDPVFEIVALDAPLEFTGYDGVIFTSENAVLAATSLIAPERVAAVCVGDRTARVATVAGFDAMSAGGALGDLIAVLRNRGGPARYLHLRGEHVSGDIAEELRGTGIVVDTQVIYDQVVRSVSVRTVDLMSQAPRPVIVPLFSARSARVLRGSVESVAPDVIPIAISTQVAEAWGEEPRLPIVAEDPTAEAMVTAVLGELTSDSAC